ncbi:MAG: glycosyltransferase [Caldilineaceae bacterium]|nr:glycosyltransferase [Caldilineaceae bacterium]
MRLLFLTPQLPYPPRQGTTLRNFNLIKQLAARHTIDLAGFLAPTDDATYAQRTDSPLMTLCRRVDTVPAPQRSSAQRIRDTLFSLQPDMGLRLADEEMRALVARRLREEEYDLVQAEGIEMAQYGCMAGEQGIPWIFDDHNCEYLLQKRNAVTDLRHISRLAPGVYSLVQWQKLARYEAMLCRTADAVTVVSEADGRALRRIAPQLTTTVVSNGIDLSQYKHDAASQQDNEARPTLVFTGKMDYRPNIDAALWFGRDVLPLITDMMPTVRFQIVGMNPHPRLDELRENPYIEITGAVEDVRPYIDEAAVYVIPMRIGGGTRFKALEAMASRKAIVSTSLGVEGIGVQDGREMLIADEPVSMASAILQLLRQGTAERAHLGEAGYRFVSAHYAWKKIVPTLEQVYEEVAETRRGVTKAR